MDRKLQRHRADSLRQHGFLVYMYFGNGLKTKQPYFALEFVRQLIIVFQQWWIETSHRRNPLCAQNIRFSLIASTSSPLPWFSAMVGSLRDLTLTGGRASTSMAHCCYSVEWAWRSKHPNCKLF